MAEASVVATIYPKWLPHRTRQALELLEVVGILVRLNRQKEKPGATFFAPFARPRKQSTR